MSRLNNAPWRFLRAKNGFTIVELLVVIVVIAILASVTVVAYSGISQRSHDSKRRQDTASIAKALMMWSAETGKSPIETGGGNLQQGEGWFSKNDGLNYNPSIEEVLIRDRIISTSGIRDPWYYQPWNGGYMVYTCTAKSTYGVFAHLEAPTAADTANFNRWDIDGCGMDTGSLADAFGMNYAHIFTAK